jgi:hypothetical protein
MTALRRIFAGWSPEERRSYNLLVSAAAAATVTAFALIAHTVSHDRVLWRV